MKVCPGSWQSNGRWFDDDGSDTAKMIIKAFSDLVFHEDFESIKLWHDVGRYLTMISLCMVGSSWLTSSPFSFDLRSGYNVTVLRLGYMCLISYARGSDLTGADWTSECYNKRTAWRKSRSSMAIDNPNLTTSGKVPTASFNKGRQDSGTLSKNLSLCKMEEIGVMLWNLSSDLVVLWYCESNAHI